MTRRGGRETSEKKSEIGGDEGQPEVARLAARCRPSNLAISVTLRKGNHPGKA